jgi:MFS family permease
LLAQLVEFGHNLRAFRALRHGNFRWFWAGGTAQALGRGMQFLALGWLVLELTHSATHLGAVMFLYGIPNLTLVLFGGIFADRIQRQMLLITSQGAVTVVLFVLAVLTVTDLVALWHLYTGSFILGTLQALNTPSRMAIVSDLVDREDIMNAVVLNSAVMNTGRIFGPAAAGAIIELVGMPAALMVNAGLYLVGTLCLFPIKGLVQARVPSGVTMLGDLAQGLRYFWTTPVPFTIITIGFAFGFFTMPYVQIMPAFALEVLGVGAGGAGLLITAAGVGSLVANVVLASLGNFPHKNWLLLAQMFIFGVGLVLFAWSTWFWVSWVILLFVGFGSMVPMGTTVLQLSVPPEMQGRILSLWYIGAGLMFIGSFPMAVVAEALGWPVATSGGAALFLLVVAWLGLWRPTLRQLKV